MVMGATYDEAEHSYTTGLVLLAVLTGLALILIEFMIVPRRTTQQERARMTEPRRAPLSSLG